MGRQGAHDGRPGWALGVAVALGALGALGACSSAESASSASDRVAAAKRIIAERLGRVLSVEVESIACPEVDDAEAGFECIGKVRGRESFLIEVAGADEAADEAVDEDEAADADERRVVWKLRGARQIEYQLALDMAERVRVAPERVTCPDTGDVSAGFDCEVVFAGGTRTTAAISAGEPPDRFRWTARGILMPGVIEEGIQSDLAATGRAGVADCGQAVRRSVPDTVFSCSIEFAGGGAGKATVFVIDERGHVQYRVDRGAGSP